jgi:HPt (histidine-containing phosphotransfer) domain-containing protein
MEFAGKQVDASSQISAAIEGGDYKLAERIAHTVKGVAGNLGLQQVFPVVEKLEKAIRERNAEVQARVEEFARVLSRQVQAIQQAMCDVIPDSTTESKRSEGFDVRAAAGAIAHLRALLESSDGDAPEAFLALERALAGTLDKPILHALSAAISEFDFAGALVKLAEISKEYGAKWERTM